MRHTYFIGYDAREHEAAEVAAFSITRRATAPTDIYILDHMTLRRAGLFDRTWRIDEQGQFWDDRDGRPFSTGFSHSRFLAFHLARELGCSGPCMFVDCDWLFLSDPSPLMDLQPQEGDLIGVVNRDRTVEEGSLKMDGMVQQNYDRKLWSAMFTFWPSKSLAETFDPYKVSTETGRDLHGFLGKPDDQFWHIDPRWHYIPSLDEPVPAPHGVHFSEFSPWLNPERNSDAPTLFNLWEEERAAMLEFKARQPGITFWSDLALALQ